MQVGVTIGKIVSGPMIKYFKGIFTAAMLAAVSTLAVTRLGAVLIEPSPVPGEAAAVVLLDRSGPVTFDAPATAVARLARAQEATRRAIPQDGAPVSEDAVLLDNWRYTEQISLFPALPPWFMFSNGNMAFMQLVVNNVPEAFFSFTSGNLGIFIFQLGSQATLYFYNPLQLSLGFLTFPSPFLLVPASPPPPSQPASPFR